MTYARRGHVIRSIACSSFTKLKNCDLLAWNTGLLEVLMVFTRIAASALALLLIAGCTGAKPATLCQGNKSQIRVTMAGKTGDNLAAPFMQALPSGTRVTILDDRSSESTVKIRIEQGEFKGQEANVARNAIRIAE
jgi:hypothetical protein